MCSTSQYKSIDLQQKDPRYNGNLAYVFMFHADPSLSFYKMGANKI